MRIDVLSIFPEMFETVLSTSMLGRAEKNGILSFGLHNVRDYAQNKHKNTDDYPFGGGAGMVMLAQPIFSAVEAVDKNHEAVRICMTPRGKMLTVDMARELAKAPKLLLMCGHYEGIDERAMSLFDREVSIGDYILTGGELPAMVLIDCVSRFIPGVLGDETSAEDESFSAGLLEYPQYTRPSDFNGIKVPEVLLNGNHALINKWRRERALKLTKELRPELLLSAELTKKDIEYLNSIDSENN